MRSVPWAFSHEEPFEVVLVVDKGIECVDGRRWDICGGVDYLVGGGDIELDFV